MNNWPGIDRYISIDLNLSIIKVLNTRAFCSSRMDEYESYHLN